MIAGFLNPTAGDLTLGGNAIEGPGVERGMVFQQGALFEWLTVSKNVDFGLRMKSMPAPARKQLVDKWLDIVGLAGFGNTPTYQLSGGMQQRVALARCLVNDPDLILMDEPLGALDALTREKMQSLILELWVETGKTIIIITHSVEEALLLGQRLFVMAPRPGRIHKEYKLKFASEGLSQSLRDIKQKAAFAKVREENFNNDLEHGRGDYGRCLNGFRIIGGESQPCSFFVLAVVFLWSIYYGMRASRLRDKGTSLWRP